MQPGVLFTLFDAAQRQRLSGNTARQIDGVPRASPYGRSSICAAPIPLMRKV
jgi:hypothetical protein